ncbi:MAG: hypothetical protein EBQ97_00710, partial [Bacteroidetes bacterium]|nr:hypothetical protein [Bacteroidota bacterium]
MVAKPAGSGIMDYMINENTLPAWSDLSVLEQLQSIYWDAYKDAHGFRPRGIDTSTWTVQDFEVELAHLAEVIGSIDQLTVFFALSPSLYALACANLKAAGLIQDNSRLVLEKPIGRDLESSKAINRAVAAVASEEQIFRIDHYLGKETVQNLIALRFANTFF